MAGMDDMQAEAIIDMAKEQLKFLYTDETELLMAMVIVVATLDYLTEPFIYKEIAPGVAMRLPNPFPIHGKEFPELLKIVAGIMDARNNLS